MNPLYTDYPFVELGDEPGKEAPIRKIDVLSYDGDKYCEVSVCGVRTSVKAGYIYEEPGRYGTVPPFNPVIYFMYDHLTYHDILCSHAFLGHISELVTHARDLGYPFIMWNDRVYRVTNDDILDIGLTKEDLEK